LSDERRNIGTLFSPGPPASHDFEQTFSRVFPALDPIYRSFRDDGVLIAAAVDGGALDAYLHISVSQRPEFAIGGRHEQCDLILGRDESVSLRHLAFAAARRGIDEVRIRVIDLQTGSGLRTEQGDACEALIAEGPLFVSVGKYQLFLLPTGSLAPTPWGQSAAETWNGFPERVYLDRRVRQRNHTADHVRVADAGERSIPTLILPPPEPLGRRRLPGDAGERIGTIELVAAGSAGRFPIHAREATRGFLIGRYERCELGVPDASLSRVHALIIEHDGKLWVVDTASTNGLRVGRERTRQVSLGEKTSIVLTPSITMNWTARTGV
jgi:hypothetical protein